MGLNHLVYVAFSCDLSYINHILGYIML